MRYILNDSKILNYLCEKKFSPHKFTKKLNMSSRTFEKILDGEPVQLATVYKIANELNVHADSIILASIKYRNPPLSRPDCSQLKYSKLTEQRYNAR